MPKHVNTNEKLGRLKRKYGFTMSEIEKIIGEFQKSNE
jgi:LysM repeat protein